MMSFVHGLDQFHPLLLLQKQTSWEQLEYIAVLTCTRYTNIRFSLGLKTQTSTAKLIRNFHNISNPLFDKQASSYSNTGGPRRSGLSLERLLFDPIFTLKNEPSKALLDRAYTP